MIDRQSCYSALFKLKYAGIDIEKQLKIMTSSRGVPREIIEFLRENSPQFQFYRYIQKHQKALAKNILDYKELSNIDKVIVGSSFITRIYIAVKYKDFDESLLDELEYQQVSSALNKAIIDEDYSDLNDIFEKHSQSLRLFYITNKEE